MPLDTNQENKEAGSPNETAPDSDTQSSASSAQGNRNNARQSETTTGRDASGDKAEGA